MAHAQASAPQAQPAEHKIAREVILLQSSCTGTSRPVGPDCGGNSRFDTDDSIRSTTVFSIGELCVRIVHIT